MYKSDVTGVVELVREREVQFIGHVVGGCRRCDRDMVLLKDWQQLSIEDRKLLRPDFSPVCSRGLCTSCYNHLARQHPDQLLDYERKTTPLVIFVEEYRNFKEAGMTDHHIAEKLGMLRRDYRWPADQLSTFDKALKRAKEAGLL